MDQWCDNCEKGHPHPSDRWFLVSGVLVCKLSSLLPQRVVTQPCKKCRHVGRYRAVLSGAKVWMVCRGCSSFIRLLRDFHMSHMAIAELSSMSVPPENVTRRIHKNKAAKAAAARIKAMSEQAIGEKLSNDPDKLRTSAGPKYTGNNKAMVKDALS